MASLFESTPSLRVFERVDSLYVQWLLHRLYQRKSVFPADKDGSGRYPLQFVYNSQLRCRVVSDDDGASLFTQY